MIKKTFNSPKFISCCDDDEVFTEEFVDGNINTWSASQSNGSIPWDRWTIDYDSYGTCEGYDLYYNEKEQVSYDKGLTWEDTSNVRKSSKIKQVCGCVIDELRTEIETKQDILVSGQNIKTINHQSLLGEGNITVQGGGEQYDDTEIRQLIADLDDNKADKSEIPTDYVDNETFNTYTAETDAKISEIEEKGYLTKVEADGYYQEKGNYATEDEITTAIESQKFKTINNESILGEGNITITGGTSGAYLPLSGGTLTGNLTLGSGTEGGFKKVETIRLVTATPNGAAFYVNSDGTAAFFHKTYGTTDLRSAVNDAILRFNNEGMFFAKGATNRTAATDFKEVLTTEKAYTKTEIDDIVGNIDDILKSI